MTIFVFITEKKTIEKPLLFSSTEPKARDLF